MFFDQARGSRNSETAYASSETAYASKDIGRAFDDVASGITQFGRHVISEFGDDMRSSLRAVAATVSSELADVDLPHAIRRRPWTWVAGAAAVGGLVSFAASQGALTHAGGAARRGLERHAASLFNSTDSATGETPRRWLLLAMELALATISLRRAASPHLGRETVTAAADRYQPPPPSRW